VTGVQTCALPISMEPRESDPYRASDVREQFTLEGEERDAILVAGRWMAIAGVAGIVAAVAKVPLFFSATDSMVTLSLSVLVPLILAAVTLVAGRILLRLKTPSPAGDQRAIAESLKWLYVVFATKGVIMLFVIAIFVIMFFAPLLLAFV